MPINTSYLNIGPPPIGMVSNFTSAVTAIAVPNAGQAESSVSIPARLIPLNKTTYVNAGATLSIAPDSALSSGLAFCGYIVPTTNTVTLRYVNASASTVTQRAATWGFGFHQGLP